MTDIAATFDLLAAVASKQSVLTTIADTRQIYSVASAVKKTGSFSLAAMIKDNSLIPNLEAIQREVTLALDLLKDPAHGPEALAYLQSVSF